MVVEDLMLAPKSKVLFMKEECTVERCVGGKDYIVRTADGRRVVVSEERLDPDAPHLKGPDSPHLKGPDSLPVSDEYAKTHLVSVIGDGENSDPGDETDEPEAPADPVTPKVITQPKGRGK
jgi:hypothetical protein